MALDTTPGLLAGSSPVAVPRVSTSGSNWDMIRIGPHQLSSPWILAPMAGVSQMPFRRIAREMGAGAAPTELVSAKGLMYGQERSERFLAHHPSERPFWVQLFGAEPEPMAIAAARAVELGADIIDINMGCPVPKVTKIGAGAALMRDPERAGRVVEAIVKRVAVPVTCKIRSGWDRPSAHPWELARRLADAGAVAVAMHARTCKQGYSGEADWSWISELVSRSPIPVIGNGDAFTPTLARRMLAETGCDAVMIGRGALGNPWIFEQLATNRGPLPPAERWPVIQRHLNDHIAHVGDELRGVRAFRPHLVWYSHGLHNASPFRRELMQIDDLGHLEAVCADFFATTEIVGTGPGIAVGAARG